VLVSASEHYYTARFDVCQYLILEF